jgi:hypothetical protein
MAICFELVVNFGDNLDAAWAGHTLPDDSPRLFRAGQADREATPVPAARTLAQGWSLSLRCLRSAHRRRRRRDPVPGAEMVRPVSRPSRQPQRVNRAFRHIVAAFPAQPTIAPHQAGRG